MYGSQTSNQTLSTSTNAYRTIGSFNTLSGDQNVTVTRTGLGGGTNCKFLPPLPLDQYKLNNDPNPEVISKKPGETVKYRQDVAFRFLEPPQAPKPGDIVVRQLPNRQIAPAPPLIVRQAPPKPPTPAPLVLREAPPQPPQKIPEQLLVVPGKVIPPPARKVVVEKLPQIPAKPQQIFLEKWLPFKQGKRRVVYQQAPADCVLPDPKNLIIQWDAPEVEVTREFRNLGSQMADPEEYLRRYGSELLRHEDFKLAAARVGAPDSVVSAESHREIGLPELEGDLQALKYVDLERNGLIEYRSYLSRMGISFDSGAFSVSSNPLGLVTTAETGNMISISEAQSIANNINGGTEKPVTESELRNYFNSLDINGDGVVSYEEFKSAASSGAF